MSHGAIQKIKVASFFWNTVYMCDYMNDMGLPVLTPDRKFLVVVGSWQLCILPVSTLVLPFAL